LCRRKHKLTDKNIPNAILKNPEFLQDSQMYQSLLEMERKLDWTMTRKKVEVQDALSRTPTVCFGALLCFCVVLFGSCAWFRQRAHCGYSLVIRLLDRHGKWVQINRRRMLKREKESPHGRSRWKAGYSRCVNTNCFS